VKIGGSTHLAHTNPHHGILDARNTQTEVVLRIWDEIVRNLIVRRAALETGVGSLRGNTAELVRRMSLQLRLTEEAIWREARQAIREGRKGCRAKVGM
jgi:hypothetical protein